MAVREFLLFRLTAPLSSFGEIAVGQRRSIWTEPSKSAIFGFLAACLGIKRDESQKIVDLEASFGFAVRVDNYGKPFLDFHTAMAPKEASRKKREKENGAILTRKSDLECDDLSTMLSERNYRTEGDYVIALWVKSPTKIAFADIIKAIKSPIFTPYLGRKSCPIGLPLKPEIFIADGLNDAFTKFDTSEINLRNGLSLNITLNPKSKHEAKERPIFFDIGFGLSDDAQTEQIRERRDNVRNRELWQFENRIEGKITFAINYVGVGK